MKTSSIHSVNFNALTYRPGYQKYFNEYLTSRDKSVLKKAAPKLANFKKWDLEITSKGLRIASKTTADAILVEESRLCEKPENSELLMEAIYDGHSETCETGKYCKFYLKHANYESALNSYEKIPSMPLVEKSIDLVNRFESQDIRFLPKKPFIEKFFDFLFK